MKTANVLATAALLALGGCALVLDDYDQYELERDPADDTACPSSCYDGPPAAKGIGACVLGTPTCGAEGTVLECVGDVSPTFEVCQIGTTDVDDDCNARACAHEDLWRYRIGDTTNVDTLTGIAAISNEGIVLSGKFQGVIGLGEMKSASSPAVVSSFVGKYAKGGIAQWIVQPVHFSNFRPVAVSDVAVNGNNEVYFVGHYLYDVNGVMEQYGYIGALSATGAPIASNFEFGGTGNLQTIDLDDTGTLHIAGTMSKMWTIPCVGTSHDPGGTPDLLFARAPGPSVVGCKGARAFSGGPHNPTDVAVGPPRNGSLDNTSVIVGTYGGMLDPLPEADPNFPNGFVLQLDGALNVSWSTWLQPVAALQSRVEVQGVATDESGAVYVVGTLRGAVNFGTRKWDGDPEGDLFVAKYDSLQMIPGTMNPDPDPEWVRIIGGMGAQKGSSVAVTRKGRIFVAGAFDTNLDFGANLPVVLPQNARGPFWVELSSAGEALWIHFLGLTHASDAMMGIAPDSLLLSPAPDDESVVALGGMALRTIRLGTDLENTSPDIFLSLIRRIEQ